MPSSIRPPRSGFLEPVVATGARSASTYELLDLGPNRAPGGGDDRILGVRPSYEDNATQLDLLFLSEEMVDLRSWTVHDYLGGSAGRWVVAADGKSVTQTVNGSPTFFVGDFEFVDRQFLGRIRVNTTSDDDFIGLVFAFHTDPTTKKPDSYYCLSWKQTAQDVAPAGLKLLRVSGMGQKDNTFVGKALWSGVNTENVQVLDTNLGSGKGWLDRATYDFLIDYSSNGEIRVEIIRSDTSAVVWQTTVVDSTPIPPGRVGFVNQSQADVTYSGLQQTAVLPEGAYQLTARSGATALRSLSGVPLDGDGDGVGGDDFVTVFVVDHTAPEITAVDIETDRVIISLFDVGGNDPGSIQNTANYSLVGSGPNGILGDDDDIAVSLGSATYTDQGNGVGQVVVMTQTTVPDGLYRLSVQGDPGVKDLAGNPLPAYSEVFDVDNTGPSVVSVEAGGVPTSPVRWLDVAFNEVLAGGTFTAPDIELRDPAGQAIHVQAITPTADRAYRVTFPEQRTNGTYTFTIGPAIYDLAENDMNRNASGAYAGSFVLALPDLTVAEANLALMGYHGDTLECSWLVRNEGTGDVTRGWTEQVLLRREGMADWVLGTWPSAGDFLASGGTLPTARSVQIPADLSLPVGTFEILVRTDTTDVIAESDETNNVRQIGMLELDRPPLPDLQITALTTPSQAAAGGFVELFWTVVNIGQVDATGSWTTEIYLSSDAEVGDDQLLAVISSEGTVAADDAVGREQSATVVLPPLRFSGDNWFVVRVNADGGLFESDASNNTAVSSQPVFIPNQLTLALGVTAVREDGDRIRATVTRSGRTAEPLIVALENSDPSELSVPATVTIPAEQSAAVFYITPIDDGVVDLDQNVTITAIAPDTLAGSTAVTVLDAQTPALQLTLSKASITEGAPDAGDRLTLTVTRDFVTNIALPVQMTISRNGQIDLPPLVEIPAGEASVTVEVDAHDDRIPEPDETVAITASAPGHTTATGSILVIDNDLPGLSITLSRPSISEGDGPLAMSAIVSRTEVTNVPVHVRLETNHPASVWVPKEVTIPAGRRSATFYIAAIDNGFVDGTRPVTITASAMVSPCSGCCNTSPYLEQVSATFEVLDNDGPTLSIVVDRELVGEGLDPAATVTVSRNTPADTELNVVLASSDTGELVLPPSVLIPVGQTSASVAARTIADGVSDGNQPVTITASAAGFTPGSTQIVVTDIDLPDLVAAQSSHPTTVLTEQYFNVSYRIENRGLAEAVASNAVPATGAAGSWIDRVFLSDDPFVGNDSLLGTYTFTGTLPNAPGLNHFARTVSVRAPLKAGDYWLVVQTDAGDSVHEGLETNNTQISATPIRIQPTYTATVETNVELAPAGTPVPLVGQALKHDGQPATYAAVNIHLMVRGTPRLISAITDATGRFATTFQPLPGEGGRYTIAATHPGVDTPDAVQDEFVLMGMRTGTRNPEMTVVEGETERLQLDIENLSDVPLHGLIISLKSHPDNLNVTIPTPAIEILPGLGRVAVHIDAEALDASVERGNLVLEVVSAEGAKLEIQVAVTVKAHRSRLTPNTERVVAAALRGQQRIVEFEVTNTGAAASGPISVRLPRLAWLSSATPETLNSLAPGESASVVLLLTPPADALLTAYEGNLILAASDSELSVPFTFRVVSEARGDLEVTTVDEFYFFTDEKPLLADATIVVRDPLTGAEIASATTDVSGSVMFPAVPEGYYKIEVRARDHDEYSETLFLHAGQTTRVLAYLPRQTVKYLWNVQEIEIEDRYEITVETVFETNVPAPVVTVDPPLIDMSNLLPGQRMQVDLTYTNHGLISAFDLQLYYGNHPEIRIRPLVEYIGELPAKSSFIVPVVIERILPMTGAEGEGSDICQLPMFTVYRYECIGNQFVRTRVATILPRDYVCRPVSPGGQADEYIGDDYSRRSNVRSIPIGEKGSECKPQTPDGSDGDNNNDDDDGNDDCKLGCVSDSYDSAGPIMNVLQSALKKIPVMKEVDLNLRVSGEACLCCDWGLSGEVKIDIGGKVEFELPLVGASVQYWVDAPGDIYKLVYELTSAPLQLKGDLEVGGRGTVKKDCGGDFSICGDVFVSGDIGLEARFTIGATLVEKGTGKAVDGAVFEAYGGVYGSWEYSYGFCDGKPSCWTAEASVDLKAGIDFEFPAFDVDFTFELEQNLWKDKVGNCGAASAARMSALTDEADEPVIWVDIGDWYGDGPGPVVATEDDLWEVFSPDDVASVLGFPNQYELEESLGITLPDGPLTASDIKGIEEAFQAFYKVPAEGICATVKLRLTQDAVLTRDAFSAELEIDNSLLLPLEELDVQIDVRDLAGNDAGPLFGILQPSLKNLNEIDGSGLLPAGTNGSVSWTIVPNNDAAKNGPTDYVISGTLRYRESGVNVTIPLEGVRVTVYPQPELLLHYFHQRDVFSDDPWTGEIEPTQPFELAVMVQNQGGGEARNLRIQSAQPQIVENEKGLLIDFKIIGSEVAGQAMQPSLLADFGNIAPSDTAIGRWWMTSTLHGQFIDYEASFTHLDGLGDPRLSLIKDVSIHELIRTVEAYGAFADGKPDFLVNDLPDIRDLPDTLYLSDGRVMDVGLASGGVDGIVTRDSREVVLTADVPEGWWYLRIDDPGDSGWLLTQVIRHNADGSTTTLPVSNFWQTDRTFIGLGRRPIYENNLHLFDHSGAAGAGTFTLRYAPRDLVGPRVVSLEQPGELPRTEAVSSLLVTFDKPVEPASFTAADLTLTRNGGENLVNGAVAIARIDATTFRIEGLAGLTASAGEYLLTVHADGTEDLFGNPGAGVATAAWSTLGEVPMILSLTGAEPLVRNTPVTFVDVEFSEPISFGSLGPEDVQLGRDGGSDLLASSLTVLQVGERTYRIGALGDLTASDGEYTLTVSATGVQDLAGNAGLGSRTLQWRMDTTGPVIAGISGPADALIREAIDGLEVTLSEAVLADTFTRNALTLTRDGGANLIDGGVTLTHLGGARWRVSGLLDSTAEEGVYSLTVSAAGLRDPAGNPGSGSYGITWTVDRTPPAAPSGLRIWPDTGVSDADGRTNPLSLTIHGQLSEAGLVVDLFDLTTNTSLGSAAVVGGEFEHEATFAAPGIHLLRARASDGAGNQADGFLEIFIDVTNPLVMSVDTTASPLDTIHVAFSEAMDIPRMIGDSTIVSAVSLTSAATGPISLNANQFVYNAGANVLSLVDLPVPLPTGAFELRLDGGLLHDRAGNSLWGGGSVHHHQLPDLDAVEFVRIGDDGLQVAADSIPVLADFNGDWLLDLIVGEKTGTGEAKIRVYANGSLERTPAWSRFSYAQTAAGDLVVPAGDFFSVSPRLHDWDGDGLVDLVLGRADGRVQWWRNIRTSREPLFASSGYIQVGEPGAKVDIDAGAEAALSVVDWNNDGRADVVVGGLDGRVRVYLDEGTSGMPDFRRATVIQNGAQDFVVPTGRASPAMFDFDDDGRKDLVVGNSEGQILFLRNGGTDDAPQFDGWQVVETDSSSADPVGLSRLRTFASDYNGDGRRDLLLGAADGQVRLAGARTASIQAAAAQATDVPGTPFVYTFVIPAAENTAPEVVGLSPASDLVTQPDEITLTALGVNDLERTVVRVAFYRGAEFLGIDEDGSDGWAWTGDTAGWPVSEHALFSRAQDNNGTWSLPASVSATVVSWRNPGNHVDVDGDGAVWALDVLLMINEINRMGTRDLPPHSVDTLSLPYFDVSGDRRLDALDVLTVINHINSQVVGGPAGEAAAEWDGAALADDMGDDVQAASPADAVVRLGAEAFWASRADRLARRQAGTRTAGNYEGAVDALFSQGTGAGRRRDWERLERATDAKHRTLPAGGRDERSNCASPIDLALDGVLEELVDIDGLVGMMVNTGER